MVALKLLKVAIIGAPNAGKSTLLNKLVDNVVSCVSNKVHTTRRNVLGVYTQDNTQLEFYDAPGLIAKQHLYKHRLEHSLLEDPALAAQKCDLIAAVVDASNIREQKRLNRGLINLLNEHSDKTSILILNKVDLVKEKRKLLDIGARLSGADGQFCRSRDLPVKRSQHRWVTELTGKDEGINANDNQQDSDRRDNQQISYSKFSRVFSISALNDDGVDELREHLLSMAESTHEWLHGPDFLTNQSSREIASNIIRGKVMDFVDGAVPYLLQFKFLNFAYDEWGSLHIHLNIYCPERYMYKKVLGDKGVTIFRIVEESRDIISNTLGCDVKLDIQVE